MATETVSRSDVDPGNFMAGVALFDDMLDEAKRLAGDESTGPFISAHDRNGEALHLFARPCLQTLMSQPALLDGFAAALGEVVFDLRLGLVPDLDSEFRDLSFDDVFDGAAGGQSPERTLDSAPAPKSAAELLAAHKVLFGDIADAAHAIATLARDALQSKGDSLGSQLVALAALADRVGYTADRAIGFDQLNADEWLLARNVAASFATLEARHA